MPPTDQPYLFRPGVAREPLRAGVRRFPQRLQAPGRQGQRPFVWHKHDETDDFFLVIKGKLDIELRDRTVSLGPGEMYIVPKGVEHRPVANEEVHMLLIEPTGTPNTGDKRTAAPRKTA